MSSYSRYAHAVPWDRAAVAASLVIALIDTHRMESMLSKVPHRIRYVIHACSCVCCIMIVAQSKAISETTHNVAIVASKSCLLVAGR